MERIIYALTVVAAGVIGYTLVDAGVISGVVMSIALFIVAYTVFLLKDAD